MKNSIEWHDLKKNPKSLPLPNEPVLITAKLKSENDSKEELKTYGDVFYYTRKNGTSVWLDNIGDDPLDWYYDIIAWASYPDPYSPEEDEGDTK